MSAAEKASRPLSKTPYGTLLNTIFAYDPDGPEFAQILAALEQAMPGFVERSLELTRIRRDEHAAKLRAEDEATRAARETQRREYDEVVQRRAATYTAVLDGGLRDDIERIRAERTTAPAFEPTYERWVAILPDGCVVGTGATRDEAWRDAIGSELDRMADAEREVDCSVNPPSCAADVNRELDALDVRFVHLVSNAPVLPQLVRAMDGSDFAELVDGTP